MTRGASSGEDRATRARPEPASGLGHPAGIPSAERQALDVLAGLSSALGAGVGDFSTTAEEYEQRIQWGIEHLVNATIQRCADVVERAQWGPSLTLGKIKTAILALQQKQREARIKPRETLPDPYPPEYQELILRGPEEAGYVSAFYEIAKMLGISAQSDTPAAVWDVQMRPMLYDRITAYEPLIEALEKAYAAIAPQPDDIFGWADDGYGGRWSIKAELLDEMHSAIKNARGEPNP
jgi:hypothetical protein